MYNGGKNNVVNELQIGNAYIAYDCVTSKLCVAAYLDNTTHFGDKPYFQEKNCNIKIGSDSYVTISIDSNSEEKYFEAEAIPSPPFGFKYVMFPDSSFPGGLRPIGKLEYRVRSGKKVCS